MHRSNESEGWGVQNDKLPVPEDAVHARRDDEQAAATDLNRSFPNAVHEVAADALPAWCDVLSGFTTEEKRRFVDEISQHRSAARS
jgi:hypothetical protein